MQGRLEFDVESTFWAAADAVFAGRAGDLDSIADKIPPEQQPLVRELRLISKVITAHEERLHTPHNSEGEPATYDLDTHGQTWGPLVVQEKIGRGAFGDVYKARELRLDRQVALKFFRPHRLRSSQVTSDVIEEGRLLARVHHPNVVTVHGAEHLDGRYGIWMEFVEGSTLEQIVMEQGPLSATETMEIGRDLCRGLTALHGAGILHRDIKARNVMREEDGRVVLMDLGISCEIDREVPVRQYGTPLYAAPEVLLANESSLQGDIYSLGVLLFFLASGRYPVNGSTLADIHAAHEKGQVDSLSAFSPDLPATFLRIVDKALAGNPQERFGTATELEQVLDDTLSFDAALLTSRPTDDRQAYNHYLQGQHFFDQRYGGGLPKAIESFRQAIALDPNFAMAHVGLADCLSHVSYQHFFPPREGFAKARATAEKALELDPDLGEVHATFGWICMFHDWDFAASEQHFRRAIKLCPHYSLARQWYALMLSSRGRDEEALAEVVAGRGLGPSSLIMAAEAVVLFFADRHQEAIQLFRLALETNPKSWLQHTYLGMALWFGGEGEPAEAPLRRAIQLSRGEEAFALSLLANVLVLTHREVEALELIGQLEALAQKRYVSPYHRMVPWIELGRYDKWGPLLERAIEERDPFLAYIRPCRVWGRWLVDPRFADPLRRAGLVD